MAFPSITGDRNDQFKDEISYSEIDALTDAELEAISVGGIISWLRGLFGGRRPSPFDRPPD
ncbi:hypothetical protein LJR220_002179 [Bradyrhizobium sp. LjRoot220]|uniref:hypothetical protein n=1 Tax=Bradyrhizobium sp. LjRoot220 TaxID=3342284 RepID=UPI003ECC81DA